MPLSHHQDPLQITMPELHHGVSALPSEALDGSCGIGAFAQPLVEWVHEKQPDAIIAADRGGRLLGLALYNSWSYRYPADTFPTRSRSVNFARISKWNESSVNTNLIHRTLAMAGIDPQENPADRSAKVMFIDDWVCSRSTYQIFCDGLTSYGLDSSRPLFVTLSGDNLSTVTRRDHFVCEEHRPLSTMSWHDDSDRVGIEYTDKGKPSTLKAPEAQRERKLLHDDIQQHYARLTEAHKAGLALACAHEIKHERPSGLKGFLSNECGFALNDNLQRET